MDIASISALVAAVGVIVGVVFAVLELRNLVKTRQTDLVIRLYSTFGSKEYLEAMSKTMTMEFKDYNDYRKKYAPSPSGWSVVPEALATNQIGTFFEGVGLLLHRKLIDISVVDDLFSSPIKMAWEKMQPVVKGLRKEYNLPQVLEWFEYLYNEMQKREQRLQQTQQ